MDNPTGAPLTKEYYNKALDLAKRAQSQHATSKSFGDRLLSLFGIRVAQKKNSTFAHGLSGRAQDVERLRDFRDPRTGQIRSIPEALSGELGKLFDAYISDTHETTESLREKRDRYNSLDFMYLNDPFISAVADLQADEACQIDQQDNLISIEATSNEQTQEMYSLLNQWNIDQQRTLDTIFNIGFYGDGLWGLKVTDRGITGVKPIHPRLLRERLEFNPLEVKERLEDLHKSWDSHRQRDAKIKQLLQAIDSNEVQDFSDMFDTYLFGFDVGGTLLPPWSAYHFRLNAGRSEYFPYGKSNFVRALAPFKQMSSSYILQAMARIMSFPVREMQVKTSAGMNEADHFERINRVREMYEGQGYEMPDVAADPYSLMSTVWSPEGLMNLNIHESKVELDFVGDIELLTDRVAISSGAPKGYLVQEWGGFGNSGISLMEQHKPFARRIYSLQSAFLDGLADIFRLHFAITGDYDHNEPFKLSMNFPNSEIDDTRQQAKTSSLDLASEVIETIANTLGVEGALPFEVIKDILLKMSFIDGKDLEKWIAIIRKRNPDLFTGSDEGDAGGGEEEGDMSDLFAESTQLRKYLYKSLLNENSRDTQKKERIIENYYKVRSSVLLHASTRFGLLEGSSGNRHFKISSAGREENDTLRYVFDAVKNAERDSKTLKG
ncbi:MAG: hypothetical protein LC687_00265 [Actinobacteria bacterium]|nr:hypothetical protein [Actinomycetota bacterium]MCA1806304.1 hypothetical protein [Actinomycetota bacterium]